MKPVLVVTGLAREGAVLRGEGIDILTGGGAPDRLAAHLAAKAPNAAAIVSFGMAGALDPDLRLGQWVIGNRLTGAFECPCDSAWVAALEGSLPGARVGRIYSDGRLIADPIEKRALGASGGTMVEIGGALAADMESHIAGEAAARVGIPFAVLRCISDEASDCLPPAIAVAMRPDGGLALGAVLASIVAKPGQVPTLIRTASRFSRAYSALKAGAEVVGPRLAFDRR